MRNANGLPVEAEGRCLVSWRSVLWLLLIEQLLRAGRVKSNSDLLKRPSLLVSAERVVSELMPAVLHRGLVAGGARALPVGRFPPGGRLGRGGTGRNEQRNR